MTDATTHVPATPTADPAVDPAPAPAPTSRWRKIWTNWGVILFVILAIGVVGLAYYQTHKQTQVAEKAAPPPAKTTPVDNGGKVTAVGGLQDYFDANTTAFEKQQVFNDAATAALDALLAQGKINQEQYNAWKAEVQAKLDRIPVDLGGYIKRLEEVEKGIGEATEELKNLFPAPKPDPAKPAQTSDVNPDPAGETSPEGDVANLDRAQLLRDAKMSCQDIDAGFPHSFEEMSPEELRAAAPFCNDLRAQAAFQPPVKDDGSYTAFDVVAELLVGSASAAEAAQYDTFENVAAESLKVQAHGKTFNLKNIGGNVKACEPPRKLVRSDRCGPTPDGKGVRCQFDCK